MSDAAPCPVADLVGKMEVATYRVNAALDALDFGIITVDEAWQVHEEAEFEIELLNSLLAAALAGTLAEDTRRNPRKAPQKRSRRKSVTQVRPTPHRKSKRLRAQHG